MVQNETQILNYDVTVNKRNYLIMDLFHETMNMYRVL